MDQIGQILQTAVDNLQPKQSDTIAGLSIKEISDLPVFVTYDEAVTLKYNIPINPPPSQSCKFCFGELKPIGRRAMTRREVITWNNYQKCHCEEAIKERKRIAAEEEERKIKEEIARTRLEHQQTIEKLFKQSKLGDRFKNRTFENFQVTEINKSAYDNAQKYIRDFNKYKSEGIGLNFNGSYGTGKTHLAAAITIELINQGIPVVMGTTITLLGKFKEAYDRGGSESEIIDLYSQVDLLVIDDLGKERVNEWVLERLYQIINNRYENNLPIVITTNYSIDDLNRRLSTKDNQDTATAITSRLWEICIGIEMNGADWRTK